MAGGQLSDDDFYPGDPGELPMERAARYWKKSANMYRLACTSDVKEAKELYMQVAMAWASLASELERAPVATTLDGHTNRPAH
jgi:hypothetical protein